MGNQVCMGAMLKCSFGVAPGTLMVLPTNLVMTKVPDANIMDNKPMLNIMPFGMCQSMANPMVIAATAAALGVLASTAVLGPEGDGDGGKSLQVALQEAANTLKQRFGRIDPAWGEVNRLRRGAVDLPVDGAPDILRAIYGKPEEDGRLGAVAGDTYILFVSWDRNGQLHSESVHQFGSATERPVSPHYADQAPLYAAMRTKPVWFTEAQLAGHVVEDYRPGQPRLARPQLRPATQQARP